MKLQKTSRILVVSLAVPLKLHLHLAVIENMDQGLSVFLAEVADVLGLLSPHMEVDVGGHGVEGRI